MSGIKKERSKEEKGRVKKYYYEEGESLLCIEGDHITELVGDAAEEERRLFRAIFGTDKLEEINAKK